MIHILQMSRRRLSLSALEMKGLVLGVYEPQTEGGSVSLSSAAKNIDKKVGGKLASLLEVAGRKFKAGQTRTLYGIDETYSTIVLSCLGKEGQGYNELEEVDDRRESIRTAVAGGVKVLRDLNELNISVDPCGDPEAAAEGGTLGLFYYDVLKKEKKPSVNLACYSDHIDGDTAPTEADWRRGITLAEGQNFARLLMESPPNHMTPTIFAKTVQEKFSGLANLSVIVRDQAWAEEKKMASFLSVSQGSAQPPVFLEIHYSGGSSSDPPVALVGKGITFDSGGISLKPSLNMDLMRADMGGAACVVASFLTAARLQLPINIKGFIPLCENMPGAKATKPGDVFTAMNGKTIQVLNTDAEGRLVLADALCYAQTFNPKVIIDMATLTGAIMVALGSAATGVFSNSTEHWNLLHKAGIRTGDRVWRMPLLKHYTKQVTKSNLADLDNIGVYKTHGGSCVAAAFLKEFVSHDHWMHLDIAGVMSNTDEVPYLGKGLTGRPTRTIVEYLKQLSQ